MTTWARSRALTARVERWRRLTGVSRSASGQARRKLVRLLLGGWSWWSPGGRPRRRRGARRRASPRRCRTARLVGGRGPGGRRRSAASRTAASNRSASRRASSSTMRGIALAVAPAGQDAGRHLVERHGGRVPLGLEVPAAGPAIEQEGVEVGLGADEEVLGRGARRARSRRGPGGARRCGPSGHADVVRLDVAVGDAGALQLVDGLEQVLAEPLEQLQPQAPLLAEPLGERLLAGVGEQEPEAVSRR